MGLLSGTPRSDKATQPAAQLDIRQLTFRRGAILRARFAPDGETVVYGAAFDGPRAEVFTTNSGGRIPGSRHLGIRDGNLLSVSTKGELSVSLRERTLRGYTRCGTMAQTSMRGGAPPRERLEGVQEADWDPAGDNMAIVTEVAGRNRLEYPPGTVVYFSPGWIGSPRFSPDGKSIAFVDHPILNDDRGYVGVVNLKGEAKRLTQDWFSAQGLAWSPSGDGIWFTAAESGNHRALREVTLDGSQRVLYQMAAALTLQDVSRGGAALLIRQNTRVGIIGRARGHARERDLSWLDWSLARDLSDDGRTLLFTEAGEGGGDTYGVYIRGMDGSEAVRLGDGSALALSPDGRWALSRTTTPPLQLMLLPTGAGEPVTLPAAPLTYQQWGCWLPCGRAVLFTANEVGKGSRIYVQDVAGGPPRCVTPDSEGVYLTTPNAVSPDGRRVAAVGPDGRTALFEIEGGVEFPGLSEGYVPAGWDANGESLYVYRQGEVPAKIYRFDLAAKMNTPLMELMPPDPAGVVEFLRVLLTPDTEAYAYTYTRDLSDLYLVNGLA